jgi:hypothetical protein
MAVTEYGSLLTAWHGEQQTVIGQMVNQVVLQTLPAWDVASLAAVDATWPPVEQALIAAVNEAYGLSSAVAVDYYELFRAAEGAAGASTALLADPLPAEQVATSLRVTGPVVARQLITAEDREIIEKLLASLLGSTSRLALNGGRNTIFRSGTADAELLGYARVCHSTRPCAFCRMLRSRGPTYSKETGGFKAHDHCRCTAEPVYSTETGWPDGAEADRALWNEVTKGFSGNDALNAFRRAVYAGR